MNSLKIRVILAITMTFVILGCSTTEWHTTPRMVDSHFGQAVRHTLANQTMYPEHTLQRQDVLTLDGQKGQGIIRPYRAPATDLRQGKESMEFDLGSRN